MNKQHLPPYKHTYLAAGNAKLVTEAISLHFVMLDKLLKCGELTSSRNEKTLIAVERSYSVMLDNITISN
jgi:hypothetical protein